MANSCDGTRRTPCRLPHPSPPAPLPKRERGDSRRRGQINPEAHTGPEPHRRGGAAAPPRQEAERNRCGGGRAAWMPREACGAMDGPSRRAPGTTMEGGNPGAAGAGCRGKPFWFLLGGAAFRRPPKETRREAKQKTAAHSIMSWAINLPART
ncbi:hypothetical protein E8F06_28990 [Pseudomonas sp. BN411]|nr:hypothetical protein [Pseudomonas sp. BN411]